MRLSKWLATMAITLSLGACSMAEWRGGETISLEDLPRERLVELLEFSLPESATQVQSLYRQSHGQGTDIVLRVRFELPTQNLVVFQETLQTLTDTPLALAFSLGPSSNQAYYPEWVRQEGRTYKQLLFFNNQGKRYHAFFDLTEADKTTILLVVDW